jgi:hypothetical protein
MDYLHLPPLLGQFLLLGFLCSFLNIFFPESDERQGLHLMRAAVSRPVSLTVEGHLA